MSPKSFATTGTPTSLRRSLVVLVLTCVVPTMGLNGWLAYDNYQRFKEQVYNDAQYLAQHMVDQIDRELTGVESGLKVLATSEALRQGYLRQFHQMARQAVKSQIVYNYVLTDATGQQIVNTLVPYGSPLPTGGTPAQLQRVFSTRQAVLTDFFVGPVTGKPAISMGVPVVLDDNSVAYSLNIGLAPEKLSNILKQAPLPTGWLAALIDSSGTIIGRTRDEHLYIGQKAVDALQAHIVDHRRGTLDTLTKEGIPVVTAHATSERWQWSVAVGAPKAMVEDKLNTMLLSLLASTTGILGLAGWVAVGIIQRLTRSVEALNQAALSIHSGQPVRLPTVQLTEADAIGRAIVQAAQMSTDIHHKAYHDTLTGLGNRALFYERLEHNIARAHQDGTVFGLLMFDLDHFKAVNDHEGHTTGDRVLQEAAMRIGAEIRETDLAARLGGDEFAVLLTNANQNVALDVAERLRHSLAQPYQNCQTPLSASIGVVTWGPTTPDGATMLEQADQALYRVKSDGRNGVALAH